METGNSDPDILLQLAGIIENSDDVLYCLQAHNNKYKYLSRSIEAITGLTNVEFMALSPKELVQLIHPDDRKRVNDHFKNLELASSGKNQSIEYRLKPKRGIYRWVFDQHKLLESNGIRCVYGILRDVTDMRLVEDAMKRSRDRLYMAIEATNDGMWDWRLDTNEIYFDARFYTMLGYDPYEFKGSFSEWMRRIHPDDLKYVQSQLNKHLEGKSDQWMIEYRFLAKSSEWVWVMNRGKIFERDENNRPLRMVGTHSDITLRKKAEHSLKEKNRELTQAENKLSQANAELSLLNEKLINQNKELVNVLDQLQVNEERFRQLAENTHDVFWLRDENKILYINPAFDNVWGRKREELYDNPSKLASWIHPDDKSLYSTWVDLTSFKANDFLSETYRIVKPDGEIRWLWTRMFPIINADGKIYRLAGIATDITEQKKTEEDLIIAKEKAMDSDRLKSAFLANISHEIRTPMNGIIGFSGLIRDREVSTETRRRYADIVLKSSNQLLQIINDIIDISKIESKQLIMVKEEVDLTEIMNDIYYYFTNNNLNLGKSNIKLSLHNPEPETPVIINTDPIRLKQVLIKLISNAYKFTEKGSIDYGFTISPENKIEFFVRDTGIGISPEMQSQIFKRFSQAESSFARKYGGIGLGLAISRGIIEQLGGTIWVESDIDSGTCFYFNHPFKKGDDLEAEISVTSVPEPDKKVYDWKNKTVLIVEDDEINQEYYKIIIERTHISIISAYSGEEAIRVFQNNPDIDLVLLDIRLPNMTGYEVFEKIKKINPSIPVIAQTAFAMPEDQEYCESIGFSDYLAKPVQSSDLLMIMNKFLI